MVDLPEVVSLKYADFPFSRSHVWLMNSLQSLCWNADELELVQATTVAVNSWDGSSLIHIRHPFPLVFHDLRLLPAFCPSSISSMVPESQWRKFASCSWAFTVFSPVSFCINHHPSSHLISSYFSFLLSCILLTFIFPSPVLKHRDFIDIELYWVALFQLDTN